MEFQQYLWKVSRVLARIVGSDQDNKIYNQFQTKMTKCITNIGPKCQNLYFISDQKMAQKPFQIWKQNCQSLYAISDQNDNI